MTSGLWGGPHAPRRKVLPAQLRGGPASPRGGDGKAALPPHLRARAAAALNFESFRGGKDKASLARPALQAFGVFTRPTSSYTLPLSDAMSLAAIVLPFHRDSRKGCDLPRVTRFKS